VVAVLGVGPGLTGKQPRQGEEIMASEQGLLDAIWEQPHDDVPRLVYADWLEEAGGDANLARAEFIRVQVELARLPGDDPRLDALEARQEELGKAWEKGWWAAIPKVCRRGYFHRGFPIPSLRRFSIPGLVRLGEDRLRAAPLWRYHYFLCGTVLDDLLSWPYLHRLDLFGLHPPLPEDWADRLAGCDNLRNASELALIDCPVSVSDLVGLLDGWAGRHLRQLTLADCKGVGDEIAAALAGHPTLAGVRDLTVRSTRLRRDGLARLLNSPNLGGLVDLDVANTLLGDDGLAALLAWPQLARLRWLSLSGNRLTDAAVTELARCPKVANLRTLLLSDNQIGPAGAEALVDSPHLERLRSLSVYSNPLGESRTAVAALRKRFGKRVSGLPDR
jgi:uncharacterized protein (TIGR02996 family)